MRLLALTACGCGLALVLAAPVPSLAQDDPGWVGRKVVQKQVKFNLKIGNQVVDRKCRIEIYRVMRTEGPWLWLKATGLEGWALAADVVPLDKAIDYFTQQTRPPRRCPRLHHAGDRLA